MLSSNLLSPAERRALADELDPRPTVAAPPVAAPPVAPQVVVKVVEKLVHVPAPAAVEHPVLGTLLHDFGYKRVRCRANPSILYTRAP
jgi:hypothetical protein